MLNGLEKKKKLKNQIFFILCIDEVKCPDLIEKQNPINETSPWKELIDFYLLLLKMEELSTGCIRSSICSVTERLNGLFDQTKAV